MEDKQIYTTARSEEIKRELIKFKNNLAQKLATFRKEKERKRQLKKKEQTKEYTDIVTATPRTQNAQNVQVIASDSDLRTSGETKTRIKKSKDFALPFLSEEKLFQIATFTIFGLIILIIALGIYLTYSK